MREFLDFVRRYIVPIMAFYLLLFGFTDGKSIAWAQSTSHSASHAAVREIDIPQSPFSAELDLLNQEIDGLRTIKEKLEDAIENADEEMTSKQIDALEERLESIRSTWIMLYKSYKQLDLVQNSKEYQTAWIAYQEKLMDRNVNMYAWHDEATKSIHSTTTILVLSGLVISVAQIVFGMAFYRKNPAAADQYIETIELSTTRIKIATTVSGMILLVITLAFFYIYVQEVYSIKMPT
ncbi:hypothetical protein [Hoeflea poritis]|uniref:Uncharacterized protein n=1 Tax=Hoeflea poritis TaxID=2993659 RepID=A0ABT4VNX1_9HYPH|nr:hypothetical protein [Hoeflea poritis]MDA4846409.1 hypothetical protein [Hoeflea poritis]